MRPVVANFSELIDSLLDRIDVLEKKVQRLENRKYEEPNQKYTIQEAAEYLNIPKGSLYQLTHQNRITFYKPGKSIYFLKSYPDEYTRTKKRRTVADIEIEYNAKHLFGVSRR